MTPNPPAFGAGTTQSNDVSCQNSLPAWLRRGVIVVAIGLFVGLGISAVYRAGPYEWGGKRWGSKVHRTDFTVYRAAGEVVLAGSDIYEAHNVRGWYYIYPPLFAILMAPFAKMSVFWAAAIWYAISVAAVIWAVKLSVGAVRGCTAFRRDVFLLYALPTLLLLVPLMSALARGQTTPMLLWLVTAGLVLFWKGHELRGALCLAGGILLKVFPAVLLAYFIWRKRWRFVGATLLAVALGVFVVPAAVYGWQKNLAYLHKWIDVVGKPAIEAESEKADNPLYNQLLNSQLPRNQSLSAVLTRLTSNPSARWVGIGTGVVMAAIIVLVGMRTPPDRELYVLSAAVAWMLLIPPVSWSHYFMLLMLPVATLTMTAMREPNAARRRGVMVALVVFGLLSLGASASRKLQVYGPLCWATLELWVVLLVVAAKQMAPLNARSRPAEG